MSTSTIRLGVKPFPQKPKQEQLPRHCVNRSQSDRQGLPGELREQSRGVELSRGGCRLEVHLHSETTRALHSENHQKEPERSSYRARCHKTDQAVTATAHNGGHDQRQAKRQEMGDEGDPESA